MIYNKIAQFVVTFEYSVIKNDHLLFYRCCCYVLNFPFYICEVILRLCISHDFKTVLLLYVSVYFDKMFSSDNKFNG